MIKLKKTNELEIRGRGFFCYYLSLQDWLSLERSRSKIASPRRDFVKIPPFRDETQTLQKWSRDRAHWFSLWLGAAAVTQVCVFFGFFFQLYNAQLHFLNKPLASRAPSAVSLLSRDPNGRPCVTAFLFETFPQRSASLSSLSQTDTQANPPHPHPTPPALLFPLRAQIARTLAASRTLPSRHVRRDASQVISAGLCSLCDQFGALIMGNKCRPATFELPINPPLPPQMPNS